MATLSELQDTVWNFPGQVALAHLHGCSCGLSCARSDAQPDQIVRTLTDLLDTEGLASPHEVDVGELHRFVALSLRELDAEALDFMPLLEEDDGPLQQRLAELADWCEGFLLGYGAVGREGEPGAAAREVLKDIVEISRVDADSDDEPHAEFELFDVVEHLRMGVLTLRVDAGGEAGGDDDDDS